MEELPHLHIQRPYASLDEYLEGDFWTVERKDMFLIGAPSFDVGVAVKFTIELADGTAVVVGEGRAVEYMAPSDEFPGGLKVRFRQLDAESKAVLRRALELRRRAYAAAVEAAGATDTTTSSTQEAAPASPVDAPPPVLSTPEPAPPVVAEAARSLSSAPKPRTGLRRSTRVVSPPANRDALLGRLRDRARSSAFRAAGSAK